MKAYLDLMRKVLERGAKKIIVIDGVPERLELAESFGAHELIDLRELPDSEQRIKRVWELTGGIGAEIARLVPSHASITLEALAASPDGMVPDRGARVVGGTAGSSCAGQCVNRRSNSWQASSGPAPTV